MFFITKVNNQIETEITTNYLIKIQNKTNESRMKFCSSDRVLIIYVYVIGKRPLIAFFIGDTGMKSRWLSGVEVVNSRIRS